MVLDHKCSSQEMKRKHLESDTKFKFLFFMGGKWMFVQNSDFDFCGLGFGIY
jgi:hypothetical protein